MPIVCQFYFGALNLSPQNKWSWLAVLHPVGLFALVVYLIASSNDLFLRQTIAVGELLGFGDWLHGRINARAISEEAKIAFELTMVVLLPLNILVTWLAGVKMGALVACAQSALNQKTKSLTESRRARTLEVLKWVSVALVLVCAGFASYLTTHEPSICRGCEQSSILFYFFIHLFGVQVSIILALASLYTAREVFRLTKENK